MSKSIGCESRSVGATDKSRHGPDNNFLFLFLSFFYSERSPYLWFQSPFVVYITKCTPYSPPSRLRQYFPPWIVKKFLVLWGIDWGILRLCRGPYHIEYITFKGDAIIHDQTRICELEKICFVSLKIIQRPEYLAIQRNVFIVEEDFTREIISAAIRIGCHLVMRGPVGKYPSSMW